MPFSTLPFQEKIPKPWGHEIKFTPDDAPYCGKIMHVNAGKRWSLHYHEVKEETLSLVSGKAILYLENAGGEMEKIAMEPEKGYVVRPGQKHRVEAIQDSVILEASSPEQGTTVRVEDDFARKDETEEIRKQPGRGWAGESI